MNSTSETIKAALAAYQGHLNTGELTTLEGALTAAIDAAAPIIAAQALRDAAKEIDIPGSTSSGYYSGYADHGYSEAERDVEKWLETRAEGIEASANFLATALADPEGQQLAKAAANLATTWGKEWAVSIRSRPNDVGEASTDPADRDEMLTQIAEWNSRHDAGAYLVARIVSPWKEERR